MAHPDLVYVTVVTRSHLHYAAALADNLRAVVPAAQLVCYLVERQVERGDQLPSNVTLLSVSVVPLPERENFLFRYTAFALCCALKPYVIAHAFAATGAAVVVYLDSDLQVLRDVEPVLHGSMGEQSVLLTPHLLTSGSERGGLLSIARAGVYNAGFLAFKRGYHTQQFLSWWMNRVEKECIGDPYGGIEYDQRWLDIAVGMFPYIGILRHPGVNVGHWNLHEKAFRERPDGVYVDDSHPLYVYHHSGLTDDRVSKFLAANENEIDGWFVIKRSVEGYRQLLQAKREQYASNAGYSFGTFADGAPITPEMRELIRVGRVSVADPFRAGPTLFADVSDQELVELYTNRPTYRVENFMEVKGKLDRLKRHVVIGKVIRFWSYWINSDI